MKERLQQTPVVVALALVCCALWGSAFPCIKIGYKLFGIVKTDIASQILFAGSRFFLAGILTVFIGSIVTGKPLVPKNGSSVVHILCLCMLQTVVQYVFFYIALAHTTGIKGAILESSNVFFSILIAALLFGMEKLTIAKIAGSVIGLAGIVLVNLPVSGQSLSGGLDLNFTLMGEGFLLISTVGTAFAAVLIRLFSRSDNPVLLSGWQFIFGGLMLILAGYATGGRLSFNSPQTGGILLYLAFLSATAYSLWSILLAHNDVSRVTVFGFMNPVFGVVLSALLLGEYQSLVNWHVPAALLLVSVGIIWVNRPSTGNRKKILPKN